MGLFKPVVFYKQKVAGDPAPPPLVTTNLILHWDFGDSSSYPGTGTTVYDLEGYRDCTFQNMTSANVVSSFGGSLRTATTPDKTARRIIYSNSGLPTPSGAFTWVVWLNRASNANLSGLCYSGNGAGTSPKIFYYTDDRLQIRLTAGASNVCYTGFSTLNTWYQLAIVRDSSNNLYTQVNDGSLINHSKTDSGNPTWSKLFSTEDSDQNRQWFGYMGPSLWYNTNLSQSQIEQNWNHFKGRA